MDLNTVSEVRRPASRENLATWREGDAWLAGGTWLFSEPQPDVRRLVDLFGLGWEPLTVNDNGLEIAATCTITELSRFARTLPATAAPLFEQCCRAFLASFKIWNMATVGGNICMSLPAGALISLTTALEGQCTIWNGEGGERRVAIEEFVTGVHENVLRPGDLLRKIDLPVSALRKHAGFRRMSLTHLGRSSVLLIATLCPDTGSFSLMVSAATVRPLRIEFAGIPTSQELAHRIDEAIPGELYFDDVHGSPRHRKHLTYYFAEELRRELSAKDRT